MHGFKPVSSTRPQADHYQGENKQSARVKIFQHVSGQKCHDYRDSGQAAAGEHEEIRFGSSIDKKQRRQPGRPDQAGQHPAVMTVKDGAKHQPGNGSGAQVKNNCQGSAPV